MNQKQSIYLGKNLFITECDLSALYANLIKRYHTVYHGAKKYDKKAHFSKNALFNSWWDLRGETALCNGSS